MNILQKKTIIDDPLDICVNENPEIKIYKNFITDIECAHMIKLTNNILKKSLVSSDNTGILSNGRSSSNCWIQHNKDSITINLANRISQIVNIPLENAEAFQIIKYDTKQEYKPHHDSWEHNDSTKTHRCMKYGGQRILTALCYLNDVEEGGSTKFTKLDIDITAEKGKMLTFKNVYDEKNNKDTYDTHELSMHCGMPVIKGYKYAFNLWFREIPKKILYKDVNPKYYLSTK